MRSSKGYTEKKLLEANKGSGGIVTTRANRLGSPWHTAKGLTEKWESTKQAVRDERETILDMSESTVLKSIKEGNTQDAKWLLSSLAKDRGYGVDGERQNDDRTLTLKIDWGTDEPKGE